MTGAPVEEDMQIEAAIARSGRGSISRPWRARLFQNPKPFLRCMFGGRTGTQNTVVIHSTVATPLLVPETSRMLGEVTYEEHEDAVNIGVWNGHVRPRAPCSRKVKALCGNMYQAVNNSMLAVGIDAVTACLAAKPSSRARQRQQLLRPL